MALDWTELQNAFTHIEDSGNKYPQIRIALDSGLAIQLRRARDGAVWINNRADRSGLAVISADGLSMRALGARLLPDADKDALRGMCRALAEDPKEALSSAGKRLGWCCICGRPLSDQESVERGVGPICYEKAGWA